MVQEIKYGLLSVTLSEEITCQKVSCQSWAPAWPLRNCTHHSSWYNGQTWQPQVHCNPYLVQMPVQVIKQKGQKHFRKCSGFMIVIRKKHMCCKFKTRSKCIFCMHLYHIFTIIWFISNNIDIRMDFMPPVFY